MQDLEIYIRDLEPGAVSGWLVNHLDELELEDGEVTRVIKGVARYKSERLRISLYPGAFGKRFTSLVIEGTRVPGTVIWIARAAPGAPWIPRFAAVRETGKRASR